VDRFVFASGPTQQPSDVYFDVVRLPDCLASSSIHMTYRQQIKRGLAIFWGIQKKLMRWDCSVETDVITGLYEELVECS
jgi:hypothetical protein